MSIFFFPKLPHRDNSCLLCVDKKQRKDNLKETTGGWTHEAIELAYDDILRYNKNGKTTEDNFDFSKFKAGALWWLDNVAGMESDWKKYAKNVPQKGKVASSAYGYTQFTSDSLNTAAKLWVNAVERYNRSAGKRRWTPMTTLSNFGDKKKVPDWIKPLRNTKDHIKAIDGLSYDQVLALTLIHGRYGTKDEDWIKLQDGDETSCKTLYDYGHHTAPDAKTEARARQFFICQKTKEDTSSWFSVFD